MRSALQLLGGVAVAGAVAAGTTAFTTSGLTTAAASASPIYGATAYTVVGASVDSILLSSAQTDPSDVDKITVVLQDAADSAALPATAVVKMTVAATNGSAVTCVRQGAGTTTNIWDCTKTTPFWTAITGLRLVVTNV